MRKRNVRKQYFLTEEENDKLRKKSIMAGMCESNLIRSLINDYNPKPKPPEEFYELLKLLRIISNNMNQIATKANTYDFIDEDFYKENVERLNKFIYDVKINHLNPKTQ